MARTIFEVGMAGYQAADDTINYQEKQKAATSILSSQAETQKLLLADKADQERSKLLARTAYNKAQSENLDVKATDLDGQMKITSLAMEALKGQPEAQENLREKLKGYQADQALLSTQQSKIRGEQADEMASVVTQTLIEPEKGSTNMIEVGKKLGNQQLEGMGYVLAGKAPVPKQFTGGAVMTYDQLSPTQKEAVNTSMRQSFPGGKIETTAHNIQSELLAAARIAQQERDSIRDAANAERKIAADRDKQETTRAASEARARDKTNQMAIEERAYRDDRNKLEDQLMKIQAEAPKVENPDSKFFTSGDSEIANPAIAMKEKQIADLETSHKENMKRFEEVDQTLSKTTGKEKETPPTKVVSTKDISLTKEEEDWITRAIAASPAGTSREEVIIYGLNNGKITEKEPKKDNPNKEVFSKMDKLAKERSTLDNNPKLSPIEIEQRKAEINRELAKLGKQIKVK